MHDIGLHRIRVGGEIDERKNRMDAATMTKKVAESGAIDRDLAERAICSTLSALGARVTGPEAHHLAVQLPAEFQTPLEEAAASTEEGERFGVDEFIRRVGDDMATDQETACRAVQAVLDTVGSGVTKGEWAGVLSQLPNEYDQLFSDDRPSDHNG